MTRAVRVGRHLPRASWSEPEPATSMRSRTLRPRPAGPLNSSSVPWPPRKTITTRLAVRWDSIRFDARRRGCSGRARRPFGPGPASGVYFDNGTGSVPARPPVGCAAVRAARSGPGLCGGRGRAASVCARPVQPGLLGLSRLRPAAGACGWQSAPAVDRARAGGHTVPSTHSPSRRANPSKRISVPGSSAFRLNR
jgi:hypothetical protein